MCGDINTLSRSNNLLFESSGSVANTSNAAPAISLFFNALISALSSIIPPLEVLIKIEAVSYTHQTLPTNRDE